ncbi:DNA polymerase I [Desulfoscipio gibsoniae]
MFMNKFLIIDGNSLIHRAFHAIPPLTTSDGTITNAVYGFTNMLFKVLQKVEPGYIAVAFDKGKITFRHASYADYKAKRKATPPELRSQFPLLKEVLRHMRIQTLELENYEADDIIGTLTKLAEGEDIESFVLTGDRDALQLVSPRVRVLLTQKGITEMEEYDEGGVWDRYGVSPPQIIDIKGLMGDASDNIPGVPGIGEKTALRLIQEHGSLEDVIADREKLPTRWRNKLTEHQDQAVLSKKLATIDRQVPLNIEVQQFKWPGPDYPALLDIFSKLEFKTLVHNIMDKAGRSDKTGKLPGQAAGGPDKLDTYSVDYQRVSSAEELLQIRKAVSTSGQAVLELLGTRETGISQAALSAAVGDIIYLLPVKEKAEALDAIADICADPQIKKICADGKEVLWLLHRHNRTMQGLAFDIQLAAYLLNPSLSQNTLTDLALQYLQLVLPTEGEAAAAARVDVLGRLAQLLHQKMVETDMDRLYYDVELPLVAVLADMEMEGVAVNPPILSSMAEETGRQIDLLVQEIYRLAGEQFNINSPKQLGDILFNKMELPVIKKTKTGFSTDASVLEELAPSHDIVAKILAYRQLAKLKSTYIDGLFGLINPTSGRIHTTFHQNVTATGRLSSSNPNLQNIPIRLAEGRLIRRVFVPCQPGNLILTADYSQIELRILAHMSGDLNLVNAFNEGQDIHSRTAAEVFGVPMEQVTPEMRGRAKAVNFGIVYGISDFGLSRDIKVSRAEAGQYIRSYFERYSGVKEFIDRKIAEARDKGYATTLLNRRRYLPDILNRNRVIRAFGERTAINTPIQGSAADIIKLAMVRIHNELKSRHMATKMILQVHDELIFDVPPEELPVIKDMVREYMENALQLDVPLVVDLKLGPNWYDVRKVP